MAKPKRTRNKSISSYSENERPPILKFIIFYLYNISVNCETIKMWNNKIKTPGSIWITYGEMDYKKRNKQI